MVHHPTLPCRRSPQHVRVPRALGDEHHHLAVGVAARAPAALDGPHGAGHRLVEHHQICGGNVKAFLADGGGQDIGLTSAEGIDLCDLFFLGHALAVAGLGLPNEGDGREVFALRQSVHQSVDGVAVFGEDERLHVLVFTVALFKKTLHRVRFRVKLLDLLEALSKITNRWSLQQPTHFFRSSPVFPACRSGKALATSMQRREEGRAACASDAGQKRPVLPRSRAGRAERWRRRPSAVHRRAWWP